MPSEAAIRVLFEDNHLFVVLKPAGILSQGDRTGDPDVLSLLAELRRSREGKSGNIYLGLVHRLDRNVAGVMVVAKTSKAAGRLSEAFRNRQVRKIYLALVEGEVSQTRGKLIHFIKKDSLRRQAVLLEKETAESQRAELEFEVIAKRGELGVGRTLLRVELGTGRFHQIRAQLAKSGTPIVGDKKYGAKTTLPERAIGLMAASLCFPHPISGAALSFTIRRPASWGL